VEAFDHCGQERLWIEAVQVERMAGPKRQQGDERELRAAIAVSEGMNCVQVS
jgi:hypothetical protein